jgi:hypothetical protein
MRSLSKVIVVAGMCLLARGAFAQTPAAAPNPIGVWRGTSICTVRPSPCHDEIASYHLTRLNADTLSFDARKIVNGQEEEMGGPFPCLFTPSDGQITCRMGNGVWNFTVRGDSLVGELRLPDKTKYRDIKTARSH